MMKELIEIEDKTIDKAIEKACQELNMPREKLNIEILTAGSTGFLGLVGSRKARIRVSIMNFETINIQGASEIKKQQPALKEVTYESTSDTSNNHTGETAKELLAGIIARMGLDFPVSADEKEEYIKLNIEGDGSGLLIGRGGQTLDAIQYIINKSLIKDGKAQKRIVLDTENYRAKREQTLAALAEKLGEKAKRIKKPVVVNPMNAHDRRIIHLALQDDKELATKSKGEGSLRKIIIVPKRGA